MPAKKNRPKRRIIRKLVIGLAIATAAVTIFLACLIIFLPDFVSSGYIRELLEKHASEALHRSVDIEKLKWKWSDGILVTGIRIYDDPIFSDKPIFSIKKAKIRAGFPSHPRSSAWKLKNHYLVFDFIAHGISAQIIRNKNGQTNLEKLLSDIEPARKEKDRKPETQEKIGIPTDVQTRIYLNEITFIAQDRAQGTQLACNDASVRLDMPSLNSEPITLNVSSEMELNKQKISPLRLNLIIENLFSSKGNLELTHTNLNANGLFSGVSLKIDTNLAGQEMKTRLKIDLAQLTELLQPFAQPPVSTAKLTGNLEFAADASGNPAKAVSFDASLKGTSLGLSGWPLEKRSLDQINLKISAKGLFDNANRQLTLESGRFSLLEKSSFLLSGVIRGLNQETPDLDIRLESLLLDIMEIFNQAKAFLPENFTLDFTESDPSPVLKIKNADFSGNMSSAKHLRVKGLMLDMPGFHASNLQGTDLSAMNLSFFIDNLELESGESLVRQLNIKTGLSIDGFRAKPGLLSPAEITGNLEFVALASGNPMQTLSFDTTLKGTILQVSGINNKTLDQADIKITNKGVFDKKNGKLLVEAGELNILQKSHILWNGMIKGLNQKTPESDIRVKSLVLDIGELFDKARAFVPKDFPLSFKESPVLEIRDADFSGPVPSGPNNIRLKQLTLTIPGLDFKNSDRSALSAANIRFAINNSDLSIKESFPAHLNLTGTFKMDKLQVKNPDSEYQISNFEFPSLSVRADNIRKSENALFGVASQVVIKESLAIKELSMGSVIRAKKIRQSMTAECVLPPDTGPESAIKNFRISVQDMIIKNKKYNTVRKGSKPDLRLDLNIAGIKLNSISPPDADIKGVKSKTDIGKIFSINMEADAKNMGSELLNTKGDLKADLSELSPDFPAGNNIRNLKLDGKAEFGWNFSGRIPNKNETEKLGSFSFSNLKKDLDFLDRLDIVIHAENTAAALTFKNNRHLNISGVSTPRSLKYFFDGKTGKGKLSGKISVRGIDEIPVLGKFEKPLSLNLSVSGEHDYLKSVRFSQVAELNPAGIKESWQISLHGADWILSQGIKTPLPLWVRHVGGNVRASVNIAQGPDLSLIMDKFPSIPRLKFGDAKGVLDMGTEAELITGQSISAKTWANLPEMNIRSDRLFSISGLKGSLSMEKNFQITTEKNKGEKEAPPGPLSLRVLQSVPGEGLMPGTEAFFSRSQALFNPLHGISFKSAFIETRPLPLKFEHTILDFDLNSGLPGLDYFRVSLSGGTLTGSVSVLRRNTLFFLQLRLAFSGLNTGKLFPGTTSGVQDEDSEISGQLWVLLPLHTNPGLILQELQTDLRFSHIGSQAIEKLLYALDPFESNEAIMSQRRLFRTGTPRWIQTVIRNGTLSLDGEVEAKGVRIRIPSLKRLNIASLPGADKFEKYLAGMESLIRVLEIFRANILVINEQGEISFEKK